jgi:F0F1-type ATP synthase membrane subunit b/b'
MIIMLLRDLLLLLFIVCFFYFMYRAIKKVLFREKVEDAIENIEETLHTADKIKEVNEKNLQAARQKIQKVIKEGEETK